MGEDGDVPGLKSFTVDVPSSGQIEFRFVQTVDDDMGLAPASDKCSKKTSPIVGPAQGLTNSWQARGAAGSVLKISLFTSCGDMLCLGCPVDVSCSCCKAQRQLWHPLGSVLLPNIESKESPLREQPILYK